MLEGVTWFGHASFRVEIAGRVIYFDPWKIRHPTPADLILISHSHFDHFSPEEIRGLCKDSTEIAGPPDCLPKFKGIVQRRQSTIRAVIPGQTFTVEEMKIEVFPAYNLNKPFHPKNMRWAGFVVTVGGQRVYHAGDTDFVKEIRLVQCDLAFVPVSGTYVMTAEEAADFCNLVKPNVAVPMHWGDIVGTRADAERFQALHNGRTEILDKAL